MDRERQEVVDDNCRYHRTKRHRPDQPARCSRIAYGECYLPLLRTPTLTRALDISVQMSVNFVRVYQRDHVAENSESQSCNPSSYPKVDYMAK